MPLIHALFEEMMKRGGSDMHLAVNQPPLARVRGELVRLRETSLSSKELEEMLFEVISPAERARLAADLELDLGVEYKDIARFRANYYAKHSGIAANFRLVPFRVPSLAELSCPEVFWRLADRRDGLLVVAGPSSGGKTTTTAALLDHINKTRACHVVTLESPVEFLHEPLRAQITQREVGSNVPSFAKALRSVRRENPDVVFVSELSTPDAIADALVLASEGILVIVNMLAGGVMAAIDTLLGAFDRETQPRMRSLLARSLAGIVVQHLIRTQDGKTRFPAYEILVGSDAVSALINDDKREALADAIRSGEAHGMQSLDVSLERLLAAGKLTPLDALDRAIDKEAFARIIHRTVPDLVDLT
jgi:twitching motility protein PilT